MTEVNEQQTKARPFLRWAGSKRKMVNRLRLFWQSSHHRYVEPFAGSACLFFELGPEAAVLGDNNSSLIETYHVVRDHPERLFRRLAHIRRDSGTYYRWRSMSPDRLDIETRALRFLYLNRNCFNGIYRTNTQGDFNVPFGRKQGAYLTRGDLIRCSSMLRKAVLVAGDFCETTAFAKKGDFVYLDPPFAVQSRRVFRQYGRKSFGFEDIPRFDLELKRLNRVGVDFLVSYADCAQARSIARQWNSTRVALRRYVAGFADHRRFAYEWLISNLPIPETIRKPSA